MVLPGHLAGGYLAARGLLAVFHPGFSSAEIDSLFIIGAVAGELPDIDLAWLYLDHKLARPGRIDNHRVYITHAPFFWLVISLILAGLGFLAGSIFTEWIGWLVLAGTWTHFLFDSVEDGVTWLWPSSKRLFFLQKESPGISRARTEKVTAPVGSIANHFQYVTRVYMRGVTFWVEIIVTLAALWLLLKSL